MGKLTLGGDPSSKWGAPSPLFNYATGKYESGGIVWFGRSPATQADKDAAKKIFGAAVAYDQRSLVGMDSPKYATFQSANAGKGPYKQVAVVSGGTLKVGTAANPPKKDKKR